MSNERINIDALIDQAVAFGKARQPAEAERLARQAIAADPASARAHRVLAMALYDERRYPESIEAISRSIQIAPEIIEAQELLAKGLLRLNRVEEAIKALRRLIERRPDAAEAHGILARALLLSGDFKHGWAEYEWRWKAPSFKDTRRQFTAPRWTGGKIAGKTILVHHEQGYGDSIQFARYVPLLAERGADVILHVPPDLVDLFRRLAGNLHVVPLGHSPPPIDFHIPMMSLPLAFNTTLKTIPANAPYLSAADATVAQWSARLANDGAGFRVGLAWAGRRTHAEDHARSIDPQAFAPLGDVSGARFYSLQKSDPDRAIGRTPANLRLIDRTDRLFNFADTAAMIANLDLVITVDTAIAHLAGAMGKPVWAMLPFVPDFRWMLDRLDSPWYPGMRLIRQPAAGQWESVISGITESLQQAVRSGNVR